ncbi:MAG TPA: CRISPR system precrRNA processing endoribonuclease RAMP protein Cas6 [Candidatus Obscuribacterales bacterium]
MQLQRYEIELRTRDDDSRMRKSPALGALMHGVLNRSVVGLHDVSPKLRPFTQYVMRGAPGEYTWVINCLTVDACRPLLTWLANLPNELTIDHYSLQLEVGRVSRVCSTTYLQLLERTFANSEQPDVSLELVTPLAFKRATTGNFCIWPEPRLIAMSALSRWNAISNLPAFDELHIPDEIDRKVVVAGCKLSTRTVAMDGVSFVGMVGNVAFRMKKDTHIRRLFHLCCAYAEFCGLGAKTAMGLGATVYAPSGGGEKAQRSDRVRRARPVGMPDNSRSSNYPAVTSACP